MKLRWSEVLLASLLIILSVEIVQAQDNSQKTIRAIIHPSFGANLTLSSLDGQITDNLIGYDKHSFYFQLVSGTFFFKNNWGLDFTFSNSLGDRIAHYGSYFDEALEKEYGSQYYVDPHLVYDYYYYDPSAFSCFKALIGPAYKIERGKIVCIARLTLGVVHMKTDNRFVILKEKSTNEIYSLSFNPHSPSTSSFIFSPSFSFGYRILNRMVLSADIGYSGYKIDPKYTETMTHATTEEATIKTYQYNSFIQEINIGIGLGVILWEE